MDRYYTSVLVAKQLLDKLSPFLETKDRDENSWSPCKINGLQLNSYVVKIKSSGLQNVLLLNTMNETHFVREDERMKPMVCMIYDYTKRKIDIPDQRMGPYTIKVKTRNRNHVTEAAT